VDAPLSRRRFLKTAFCSSAALSLNVRSHAGSQATGSKDIHLLMLGDFGSGLPAQAQVAATMRDYTNKLAILPNWLVLLGDNFYHNAALGGGITDQRWESGFENMYPKETFPCPCPAILGNHDYHDSADGPAQQLAYAKTVATRWTMPAKWYRLEIEEKATFLFIDTNLRSISGRMNPKKPGQRLPCLTSDEEEAQWKWISSQLASERRGFTFVVGHHPVYSNGAHGDSPELVERLAPLLERAAVHWYIAGHDHDLQHLELEKLKTSYVISGGGGANCRPLKNFNRRVPFAEPSYGFSHIALNSHACTIRHINSRGEQVHGVVKDLNHDWRIISS
jgi:tartrate-resistant acid phosphatase type 5